MRVDDPKNVTCPPEQVYHRAKNYWNHSSDRAFSLIELMVVLAVTVLLAGLLMPSMSQVRENANRIICSANQRSMGQSIIMYEDDHGHIPRSTVLLREFSNPRELMAAHLGETAQNWDGLGRLYGEMYLGRPEVFYCPSHTGNHPFEVYDGQWESKLNAPWGAVVDEPIYTNYHYAGHRDWITGERRTLNAQMVLVTDGLRTVEDFNHQTGMNILHGDGSVRYRDSNAKFLSMLAETEEIGTANTEIGFTRMWKNIEKDSR